LKWLCIWAVILAVLILIGQIRLGGIVIYGADGLLGWVRIGPFRVAVYPPNPNKTKKPKKKQKKAAKTKGSGGTASQAEQTKPPKSTWEKIGGALDYARSLLPVALEAAEHVYGKLRMDKLELLLTVGAKDPADAAALYGQASAVLGSFWYPLTQAFHVADGHAKVELDFDAPDMTLYAEASLSLKLGQALWLALYFGIKALRAFLAARKRQKSKQNVRKAV